MTCAVVTKVRAGALSGIVALAGKRAIAIGVAGSGGGGAIATLIINLAEPLKSR